MVNFQVGVLFSDKPPPYPRAGEISRENIPGGGLDIGHYTGNIKVQEVDTFWGY